MVKIIKGKNKDLINKDMLIQEIAAKYPGTMEIMMDAGLHCVGCHGAMFETLEQGTLGHGMTDKELEKMLKDLNKIAVKK